MKHLLLLTGLAVFLIVPRAHSQTWNGSMSNDWGTPNNWTPASVPGPSNTAVINSSASVFPKLTSAITVGGLTMATGSQLDINGQNLVINGNTNLSNATITGGGNLTSNGSGSFTIADNTINANVSILNFTGNSGFYRNTITGNTVLEDASSNNSGIKYMDGNTIIGDFTFNYKGTGIVYEGYNGGTAIDSITGNATINISNSGTFYSSYAHGMYVGGDLLVNRTVAGSTQLYRSVTANKVLVGGDFTFNSAGGSTSVGDVGKNVIISGKVNMSIPNLGAAFSMANIVNNTAGGNILVSGASYQDVQDCQLIANVTMEEYTSNSTFYRNTITGNTLLGDASSNNSGSKIMDGNVIIGNFALNYKGKGTLYEGYNGGPAIDSITGNAIFNISNSGTFYSSYAHGMYVGGNLLVNRTVAGSTQLYRSVTANKVLVGGDFTFNSAGGSTTVGDVGKNVIISGKVNMSIPNLGAAFSMANIVNNTAGGNILVSGASYQDVQDCQLIANVTMEEYTSNSTFYRNTITGNTLLGDASSNNSGSKIMDGNTFNGDFTLNFKGKGTFYQGYSGGAGRDSVLGNAVFNISNSGTFYGSYSQAIHISGNLILNRTSFGSTILFNTVDVPSSIGGNMTINSKGYMSINPSGVNSVSISGMVNLIDTAGGVFIMRKIINSTTGGNVLVLSATSPILIGNKLKSNLNVNQFVGNLDVYNNLVEGNFSVSDSSTNNSGAKYMDGNKITGNFELEFVGTGTWYEGYNGGVSADSVLGNMLVTISNSGTFYGSYLHPIYVGGNFILNRTVAGSTTLYNTNAGGAMVGGNFSFSTIGGPTAINSGNNNVVNVLGTFDANINGGDAVTIYKMKNQTSGGTVQLNSPSIVNFSSDTLMSHLNINQYTSNCGIYDNMISGNTRIVNAVSNNSGAQYLDANYFKGNFTLIHQGSGTVYEGYNSGFAIGNRVAGIDSILAIGTGTLNMSYTLGHTHQADSNFVLVSGASGLVFPRINFGGSTNGTFVKVGAPAAIFNTVVMKKTGLASLSLVDSMGISGNLNFTGGIIASSTARPLFFLNNATTSGATNSSHVTGLVKKIGNDAFTFPLGDGDALSPLAISAPSNATDIFTAEYFNNSPQSAGYDSTMLAAGLDHISASEYWILNRTNGNSNVTVQLGFNQLNSGVVNLMTDLRVAHWNGTQWLNEGNGGTTGTNSFGTVVTSSPISSFSPFTIGSSSASNPLPIQLLSFSAVLNGKNADLRWAANNEDGLLLYDLQHSSDGKTWETIATQEPKHIVGANEYSAQHQNLAQGANFYRLMLKSNSGELEYSQVLKLMLEEKQKIEIYPNPVQEKLYISGVSTGSTISIVNAQGKIVFESKNWDQKSSAIDLSFLTSGTYFISIESEEANFSKGFIKK